MGSPPREHKAVENGGRGRLMARQGSSSPLAAVVHVAGRNDRHPIREKTNQIQSSLETCLVETIRTAAPVATARATTRVQATTTTKGSIMAARIRLVDANVTIARRSLTRMAGHTEGAEELTSLGAPGATQLDGVTLAVEISSLPEGFPTTPGPTEPALTTDKNFINADVVMICRLKERIAKLNEISSLERLFPA